METHFSWFRTLACSLLLAEENWNDEGFRGDIDKKNSITYIRTTKTEGRYPPNTVPSTLSQ